MRLLLIQIIAGIGALAAFIAAFAMAGVFLASFTFMVLGLAALGWLAFSLIRRVRARSARDTASNTPT